MRFFSLASTLYVDAIIKGYISSLSTSRMI